MADTPKPWGVIEEPEQFEEPRAKLTPEQLAEVAKRGPVPMPEHHPELTESVKEAWGLIGRIWPEMASKVRKITEYDPATVPKGIAPPNAFIDPSLGILAIRPNTRLDPQTLWHELVHLEQQQRGIMRPRSELDPDVYNLIESEAVQRAKKAGEVLASLGEMIPSRAAPPQQELPYIGPLSHVPGIRDEGEEKVLAAMNDVIDVLRKRKTAAHLPPIDEQD